MSHDTSTHTAAVDDRNASLKLYVNGKIVPGHVDREKPR